MLLTGGPTSFSRQTQPSWLMEENSFWFNLEAWPQDQTQGEGQAIPWTVSKIEGAKKLIKRVGVEPFEKRGKK